MAPSESELDLSATRTVAEAADAVADYLVTAGMSMPSVYASVAGRLRCVAQRGYWQVHDGVPPEVGILGATFRAGVPTIIQDVRESADSRARPAGSNWPVKPRLLRVPRSRTRSPHSR